MKKGKNQKLIYMIAAFWLLMTGICIDCSQAYSVLAYYDAVDSSAYAYHSTNGFTSDEVCTSDLMGQGTVVKEAKALEDPGVKGRTGIRSALAVPQIMSHVPHPYYGMAHSQTHREVRSHTVIMNYIHSKDGRKP